MLDVKNYESPALTTELQALEGSIIINLEHKDN